MAKRVRGKAPKLAQPVARLQAAAWIIALDGTETWVILERAFWQRLKISCPAISLVRFTGRCLVEGEAEGWDWKQERKRYWLVRRVELDKHYPSRSPSPAFSPETAPVAAPNEQADNPTAPRRAPGPKPREDWPNLVGAWLVAEVRKKPEKFARPDRINVNSLVEDAAAFLQEQIGWAPKDDKDLRARIVSYLRLVRP
jgi:hypothetical protein